MYWHHKNIFYWSFTANLYVLLPVLSSQSTEAETWAIVFSRRFCKRKVRCAVLRSIQSWKGHDNVSVPSGFPCYAVYLVGNILRFSSGKLENCPFKMGSRKAGFHCTTVKCFAPDIFVWTQVMFDAESGGGAGNVRRLTQQSNSTQLRSTQITIWGPDRGRGDGGPMLPVWILKRLVSVFINACRLLSALPSLSQFGRGRLSLVAISFYALSLLFGLCRLSEFTLAGPHNLVRLILRKFELWPMSIS